MGTLQTLRVTDWMLKSLENDWIQVPSIEGVSWNPEASKYATEKIHNRKAKKVITSFFLPRHSIRVLYLSYGTYLVLWRLAWCRYRHKSVGVPPNNIQSWSTYRRYNRKLIFPSNNRTQPSSCIFWPLVTLVCYYSIFYQGLSFLRFRKSNRNWDL